MRLFIGIDFPDYVTRHLSQLRGSLTYVRWYDPRTYHLTLNFIGEINDYDLLNDLDLTLKKISPPSFNLTIDKVNLFQTASNTQILWAGIQPSESLVHLRKKVEQILRQLEIKTQKQKFVPHITLGKGSYLPQEHIKQWLNHYNLLKIPDIEITHFSLFSSYPGKEQPNYIIEKNYPLSFQT